MSKSINLAHVPPSMKPKENKEDYLYIMPLEEPSPLNLKPDDIDDVKAFGPTKKLPERLVFRFTPTSGKPSVTHPMNLVLQEGYKVLLGTFAKMQHGAYSEGARTTVREKIMAIRETWQELPKVLEIPYTGKVVHKVPHHLIEFRDKGGVRRFFRLKDQLKIAHNDILRFLQTKLRSQVGEEADFHRILQDQIEKNILKEQRDTR